jgi:hypothetical protein
MRWECAHHYLKKVKTCSRVRLRAPPYQKCLSAADSRHTDKNHTEFEA